MVCIKNVFKWSLKIFVGGGFFVTFPPPGTKRGSYIFCTTWYLKAYRFRLSSVYFGRYHFLTIIFILVNTSRCNLHANKIFWNSHLSFRLFWDFCSQKSIKMMVNFGSLIFGDKRAVFFVQYLLIPVNLSTYWCKFHLFYVWNI